MEKVTEYRYGVGSLEEVRDGSVKKRNFSLSKIKRYFARQGKKKGIILPEVVGIYQEFSLVSQREFEKRAMPLLRYFVRHDTDILEEAAKFSLESRTGLEDRVNPYLISVCYNPNVVPEVVIRDFLRDFFGRVLIRDCREIPNFYDKGTEELEIALEDMIRTKDDEERKKNAERTGEKLDAQLKNYGLTRDEYAFLKILQNVRNPDMGGFVNNPVLMKSLSEFLSLGDAGGR